MTPQEYIDKGTRLQNKHGKSDGCTFINWLIPKKYRPACWAHDYTRAGYMVVGNSKNDQSDNDNMFRNALRHLGMGKLPSSLIYLFTRIQGAAKDKWGLGALEFVIVVLFAIYVTWLIHGAATSGA